jgi:preprotein translocase subunit SecE
MNRQTKRLQERMERRQRSAPPERQAAADSARRAASQEKKKRTSTKQFLKEVRQELKRVDWPARKELFAYTVVVLVSVVVLTSIVFGLDFVFSKFILHVLGG